VLTGSIEIAHLVLFFLTSSVALVVSYKIWQVQVKIGGASLSA
jgi:hypothetical protein